MGARYFFTNGFGVFTEVGFPIARYNNEVSGYKLYNNQFVLSAGASATVILLSILVSNKTGSSANVDVYLVTNTGDDVYLIRNAPVPAGSSLEIISGNKIIMESSDVLRARADTATALDIAVSYLEQT